MTIQDTLFGLFHVIVGSRQGKRLSFFGKFYPLFLYFFDSAQLLSLTVSREYGWPKVFSDASKQLSIERQYPSDNGTNLYYVIAGIVLFVILVMALLVSYALYVFRSSSMRSMWPLRLLRTLVHVTTTALYVPIVSILVRTISCSQLESVYHIGGDVCWNTPHSAMVALSILCTIFFVPMSLVMGAAMNDANPRCDHPNAKINPRSTVMYTSARTLIVLIYVFFSSNRTANSVFFCLILLSISAFMVFRLPYFHLNSNCLHAGVLGFIGSLNGFSAIMDHHAGSSIDTRLVIGWVGFVVSLLYAGLMVFAARFRWKWICTEVMRFESAYSGKNGEYEEFPHPDTTNVSKQRKKASGALDYPQFSYFADMDVELYARAVIFLDFAGKQSQRNRPIDATPRAIKLMHCIFRDGKLLYPGVGRVHMAYSLYLQAYTDDQIHALSERNFCETAMNLDIITSYTLFAANHDSINLITASGLNKGLDSVAMVEYKNLLTSADVAQLQALEETSRFWSNLNKLKHDPMGTSRQIQRIMTARDKTTAALDTLLLKYPNSVEVLRAYATFLINVLDEDDIAREYVSRAEMLEKEQSKVMVGSALDAQSDATSLSRASSMSYNGSWKVTQRKLKDTDKSIRTMGYKMILSIILILLSLSISFTYVTLRMASLEITISNLNLAGSRRKAVSYIAYTSRLMQVGVMNDDAAMVEGARKLLIGNRNHLLKAHEKVYMQDLDISGMEEYDKKKVWDMIHYDKVLGKDTEKVSLWVFGQSFLERSKFLTDPAEDINLKTPHTYDKFLFVMWNAMGLMACFEGSMGALEDNVFDAAHESMVWTISLMTLVIICVIGMVVLVFRPAMKGVEKSMENVHSIMWEIPHNVVTHQKRTFARRVIKERSRQNEVESTHIRGRANSKGNLSMTLQAHARKQSEIYHDRGSFVSIQSNAPVNIDIHSPSPMASGRRIQPLHVPDPNAQPSKPALSPRPHVQVRGLSPRSPAPDSVHSPASNMPLVPLHLDSSNNNNQEHGSPASEGSRGVRLDGPDLDPDSSDCASDSMGADSGAVDSMSDRGGMEDSNQGSPPGSPPGSPVRGGMMVPMTHDLTEEEEHTDEEEKLKRIRKTKVLEEFDSSVATRKFSLRLYLVCLIIILAASGLTAISVISLEDGKYLAADLNNGGRRRFVPANIAHITMECMINDGIMFSTSELCVNVLHQRNQYFMDIHQGLQTGNSSMRLKGADGRNAIYDYILYEQPCLFADQTSVLCDKTVPRTDIAYGHGAVSLGYDYLIKAFVSDGWVAKSLVQMALAADNSTGQYDWSYLTQHDQTEFLRTVSTKDMAWGAALTANVIDEEVSTVFSSFRVTTALVFSGTSFLIVIVYIFLLRPLVSLLKSETARQWDLLLLIPEDVIMENKALGKYYNLDDDYDVAESVKGAEESHDEDSDTGDHHENERAVVVVDQPERNHDEMDDEQSEDGEGDEDQEDDEDFI